MRLAALRGSPVDLTFGAEKSGKPIGVGQFAEPCVIEIPARKIRLGVDDRSRQMTVADKQCPQIFDQLFIGKGRSVRVAPYGPAGFGRRFADPCPMRPTRNLALTPSHWKACQGKSAAE